MEERDERDFPHASIVEGLRFTAQVAVPNVIQGLFRRRRTATAVADRAGAEGLASGFMASLKRSYGNGPLWVRVGTGDVLLVLGRDAIRRVLEAAPDPFAADPEPKRSGMAHFQPDALTISRGSEWEERRQFTEAVLDTRRSVHRLGDRFVAVAAEEGSAVPEQLDWESWNALVRRVARRIVLGDAAADEEELSTMLGALMEKANPRGRGDEALLERFTARLQEYLVAPEPGSLVALFGEAPVTPRTEPARQVTHWLFALGDTLAVNVLRCLVLLATFELERARVAVELERVASSAGELTGAAVNDLARLGACLQEAMRLWPTTPILARETVRDIDWDGVTVPAGTQVLIVNSFNHRDREVFNYADRFSPEQWLSGSAAQEWSFNHFAHGPQGCPGAALALLVGKALLATVLRERELEVLTSRLEPARPLPHSLDYFSLQLKLPARAAAT